MRYIEIRTSGSTFPNGYYPGYITNKNQTKKLYYKLRMPVYRVIVHYIHYTSYFICAFLISDTVHIQHLFTFPYVRAL